ncbi:type VII secretion target [Mycobacterium deserti]|uniref:Type VII secretion target n=1 Tax=Mycobacterium deserti TaxID=2978347 RepID=A0ABT2MEW7_9MYCO|nr:type VII secretion target [Mycobacterium deserti]MCT7660808.1 type VII secretion target [Mycobacterium deserti]
MRRTLVEPMRAGRRPNGMFADTDAIRALGNASGDQAADLAAIAAALSTLPGAGAAEMLGPVGAGFLAALAEAAADGARAVTALSDRLSATGGTAFGTAAAYDAADHDAGTSIIGV